MPLLWVLRDTLNLTGTKFGCGMALCKRATVHIDGEATRSCITPISEVAGKKVALGRPEPSSAEGVDRDGRAVRLLPVRANHVCSGAAGEKTAAGSGSSLLILDHFLNVGRAPRLSPLPWLAS
jgi:hypothetical protein